MEEIYNYFTLIITEIEIPKLNNKIDYEYKFLIKNFTKKMIENEND